MTPTQIMMYVFFGVVLVALIAWFVFSGKKNKQQNKEYVEQLEAIRPGHKVKSAGGICGVVVEVCDDNTVILETGSEQSGHSYIKLDKESIYQTDAKGPSQIAREEAEARKKNKNKEKSAEKSADAPEAPENGEAPEETGSDGQKQ